MSGAGAGNDGEPSPTTLPPWSTQFTWLEQWRATHTHALPLRFKNISLDVKQYVVHYLADWHTNERKLLRRRRNNPFAHVTGSLEDAPPEVEVSIADSYDDVDGALQAEVAEAALLSGGAGASSHQHHPAPPALPQPPPDTAELITIADIGAEGSAPSSAQHNSQQPSGPSSSGVTASDVATSNTANTTPPSNAVSGGGMGDQVQLQLQAQVSSGGTTTSTSASSGPSTGSTASSGPQTDLLLASHGVTVLNLPASRYSVRSAGQHLPDTFDDSMVEVFDRLYAGPVRAQQDKLLLETLTDRIAAHAVLRRLRQELALAVHPGIAGVRFIGPVVMRGQAATESQLLLNITRPLSIREHPSVDPRAEYVGHASNVPQWRIAARVRKYMLVCLTSAVLFLHRRGCVHGLISPFAVSYRQGAGFRLDISAGVTSTDGTRQPEHHSHRRWSVYGPWTLAASGKLHPFLPPEVAQRLSSTGRRSTGDSPLFYRCRKPEEDAWCLGMTLLISLRDDSTFDMPPLPTDRRQWLIPGLGSDLLADTYEQYQSMIRGIKAAAMSRMETLEYVICDGLLCEDPAQRLTMEEVWLRLWRKPALSGPSRSPTPQPQPRSRTPPQLGLETPDTFTSTSLGKPGHWLSRPCMFLSDDQNEVVTEIAAEAGRMHAHALQQPTIPFDPSPFVSQRTGAGSSGTSSNASTSPGLQGVQPSGASSSSMQDGASRSSMNMSDGLSLEQLAAHKGDSNDTPPSPPTADELIRFSLDLHRLVEISRMMHDEAIAGGDETSSDGATAGESVSDSHRGGTLKAHLLLYVRIHLRRFLEQPTVLVDRTSSVTTSTGSLSSAGRALSEGKSDGGSSNGDRKLSIANMDVSFTTTTTAATTGESSPQGGAPVPTPPSSLLPYPQSRGRKSHSSEGTNTVQSGSSEDVVGVRRLLHCSRSSGTRLPLLDVLTPRLLELVMVDVRGQAAAAAALSHHQQ